MTRAARWRKATRAVVIGWLAAFLVTSPFQIFEVLRNSGQSLTLLISALGYGFAAWFLITFAGVLLAWICIATPVALYMAPQCLIRQRGFIVTANIAAAFLFVFYQLHLWTFWYHDGVGLMNFAIDALFAAVFSGIASHSYLRFLTRDQNG